MIEYGVIGCLLLIIFVQQGVHVYHTHKLLNKLMVRNYGEYIQAETYKNTVPSAIAPGFKVDMEEETLGAQAAIKAMNSRLLGLG